MSERQQIKESNLLYLMLDSGAYSAWNKGVEIDIDKYIAYIKRYEHVIGAYVNLDVIPGSPEGDEPTAQEADAAAQASWDNLKYMESKGLHPVPVFHYGEPFKWLRKMLDEGYEFVGLGGIADTRHASKRLTWLDFAFTILTDGQGWPLVKVHGFALTSTEVLVRYPWFSCDSASWMLLAGYGKVVVPYFHPGGIADYTKAPRYIHVSEKGRVIPVDIRGARNLDVSYFEGLEHEFDEDNKPMFRRSKGGLDIDHRQFQVGSKVREQWENYMKESGTTYEECKESLYARMNVSVYYFSELQKHHQKTPFKYRTSRFFDGI